MAHVCFHTLWKLSDKSTSQPLDKSNIRDHSESIGRGSVLKYGGLWFFSGISKGACEIFLVCPRRLEGAGEIFVAVVRGR